MNRGAIMKFHGIPLMRIVLLNHLINMTRRQKRAQIFFRKPPPAYVPFETVRQVLEDCNFEEVNVDGDHFVYSPKSNREVQKMIRAISGRKVGRNYFERIRRNIMRFCPDLLGGQR